MVGVVQGACLAPTNPATKRWLLSVFSAAGREQRETGRPDSCWHTGKTAVAESTIFLKNVGCVACCCGDAAQQHPLSRIQPRCLVSCSSCPLNTADFCCPAAIKQGGRGGAVCHVPARPVSCAMFQPVTLSCCWLIFVSLLQQNPIDVVNELCATFKSTTGSILDVR
jgi:hypothetical protein